MQGSQGIAERVAKLEALFACGATEGAGAAAGAAIERLQARPDFNAGASASETQIALQYSLPAVRALRLCTAAVAAHDADVADHEAHRSLLEG